MIAEEFLRLAAWSNRTENCQADRQGIQITSSPGTDLWQRTYYGFQVDNVPCLMMPMAHNDTFTVRARFDYRRRYDQCGVLLRHQADWFKASIEHESDTVARLGSVLTTNGYSDWATTDIAGCTERWYRISRRGPDFRLEHSSDGHQFAQMRVFHLHSLGDTDLSLCDQPADRIPAGVVHLGVYACSPEDSTFTARFDQLQIDASTWHPHA